MRRKLSNALLIANYAMNHDTAFVDISVLCVHHGFSFMEVQKMERLRRENDFIGDISKDNIVRAIKAIGYDDCDIFVYVSETHGKKSLCFAN